MALLNLITGPWECGLVPPLACVWCGCHSGASVLLSSKAVSPLREKPLPSAQRHLHSHRDTWRLRGGSVHAASAEVLYLCAWAVFICVQPTFTCGLIPACHVPVNVWTFGTPHVYACHFYTGASLHIFVAASGHYVQAS